MASIQIEDVPDEVHAVLLQRAAVANQSLQEYLRSKLIAEAGQPTLDEVLDRVSYRSGGEAPLHDVAAMLAAERA